MRLNLKEQKLTGQAVRISCCGEFRNLDVLDMDPTDFYSCTVCQRPFIIRGQDGKVYLINDKPVFER